MKLIKGQEVQAVFVYDAPELQGRIGIVYSDNDKKLVGVEFPAWNGGHSCNTGDGSDSRWYIFRKHLKPVYNFRKI